MSFVVVVDHFGADVYTTFIRKTIGGIAVPCFMFISFYLLSKKFEQVTGSFIKKRLKRLYIPVIFWNSVTLIVYLGLQLVNIYDWRTLIYSFIFGSSALLVPALWFNMTQIFITIFLSIFLLIYQDNKFKDYILVVIVLAMFFIQYTGINAYLFESAPYESRYTLGRFAETLPLAITGLFYGKHGNKFSKKYKIELFIICTLISVFFIKVQNYQPKGFGYAGFPLYFISVLVCISMISIPFNVPAKITKVINYVSNYSMGIYCMHFPTGRLLASACNRIGIPCDANSIVYDV